MEDLAKKKEKNIIIIVNGEEKEVKKEKISYEEVIMLAFGSYNDSEDIAYTIMYFRGNNEKPNGFLLKGQEVNIKKEMKFNVSKTNRS